ncbi:polysaccharide deacetylase family protein [Larkinella humicola]|uniref:Polysaccharide deacetylase family protein n=1 Tax=Larkinella humicola TaxID=2607654 RepID=A0A5N1JLQ3_9BACT|nr:polysaccharide deacetylase family protein [Larkinella humicola]KAA9357124.1 polysaccharide deacetylase family protein [Larkinella humicola]
MSITKSALVPLAISLLTAVTLVSCSQTKETSQTTDTNSDSATVATAIPVSSTTTEPGTTLDPATIPAGKIADAATILSRKQVPILCYHQIREWRAKDSKSAKDYICPTSVFEAQIKMLADSGYHAILPDQLYAYLTTGAPLPSKPVMITFDDGDLDQYETAVPILEKHNYKAAFFIMTVAIGRRGYQPYMDKQQIKDLADRGHTIGCHTWDHHNVKKYQDQDWVTQIEEPTKKLEAITGKPVKHFAYPFGLWNHEATVELKKRGYLGAYQLAEKKRDDENPLLSVRRIIASGYWSPRTLHNSMVNSFK